MFFYTVLKYEVFCFAFIHCMNIISHVTTLPVPYAMRADDCLYRVELPC